MDWWPNVKSGRNELWLACQPRIFSPCRGLGAHGDRGAIGVGWGDGRRPEGVFRGIGYRHSKYRAHFSLLMNLKSIGKGRRVLGNPLAWGR